MAHEIFETRCDLNVAAAIAFAWHKRPDSLALMMPPWPPAHIVERSDGIADGARVTIRVDLEPFAFTWVLEHCNYIEGRQFCDKQVSGPFGWWYHKHMFEPTGDNSCTIIDRIEYALPSMANFFPGAKWAFRKQLTDMFAYRHRVLTEHL